VDASLDTCGGKAGGGGSNVDANSDTCGGEGGGGGGVGSYMDAGLDTCGGEARVSINGVVDSCGGESGGEGQPCGGVEDVDGYAKERDVVGS
jgi:hypothetical protein